MFFPYNNINTLNVNTLSLLTSVAVTANTAVLGLVGYCMKWLEREGLFMFILFR